MLGLVARVGRNQSSAQRQDQEDPSRACQSSDSRAISISAKLLGSQKCESEEKRTLLARPALASGLLTPHQEAGLLVRLVEPKCSVWKVADLFGTSDSASNRFREGSLHHGNSELHSALEMAILATMQISTGRSPGHYLQYTYKCTRWTLAARQGAWNGSNEVIDIARWRRPRVLPLINLAMDHGLPVRQVDLKRLYATGSRGWNETMENRRQLRCCHFT